MAGLLTAQLDNIRGQRLGDGRIGKDMVLEITLPLRKMSHPWPPFVMMFFVNNIIPGGRAMRMFCKSLQ